MLIPERFKALLELNQSLYGMVLKALTAIEPWAKENKTVFFQEYTDHSLVHMTEVLATADSLISDESWSQLTAHDAAIIIVAVLLHDSALHLSEDGFFALIGGAYVPAESRYIAAETPWKTLWESFLVEARRFDQHKLSSLFGAPEPIGDFPASKLDLTLKHRLLVGEFLRRHHARLAHEIAISGIPGPSIPFNVGDFGNRDILDLCGYVARSHNMPLRGAIDHIEPVKRRVHLNAKVPFAMVVLRIADYIQIHSSRAPGQLLDLRGLVSPVSRGEWKKHAAVREINQAHDDPESIFVDCEPDTARSFVAMRNLLSDIQRELDQCWAVMGEVYGRFSPLDKLGIAIRRIRSNIDNPAEFRRTRNPSYIPKEYKFTTASAELMEAIEISPCRRPSYGTSIEIDLSVEVTRRLADRQYYRDEWDWFCLAKPTVKRFIVRDSNVRTLEQGYTVPQSEADITPTRWRRIVAAGYDDVLWSYEALSSRAWSHPLVCNGVFITEFTHQLTPDLSPKLGVIVGNSAALVVFDSDGRFPLNLQRSEVSTKKLDFDRLWALDISSYFVAGLVQLFDSVHAGLSFDSVSKSVSPNVAGLNVSSRSMPLAPITIFAQGIVPTDWDLLAEVRPSCVVVDAINVSAKKGAFTSETVRLSGLPYIAVNGISQTKRSRVDFVKQVIGSVDHNGKPAGYFAGLPVCGSRILVRRTDLDEIVSPGYIPKSLWAQLTLERDFEKWGLWALGSVPEISLDALAVSKELDATESFGVSFVYFDWSMLENCPQGSEHSPFAEAWKLAVRSALMPQRMA